MAVSRTVVIGSSLWSASNLHTVPTCLFGAVEGFVGCRDQLGTRQVVMPRPRCAAGEADAYGDGRWQIRDPGNRITDLFGPGKGIMDFGCRQQGREFFSSMPGQEAIGWKMIGHLFGNPP